MSIDRYRIPEWLGVIMIPCLFYSTALTSILLTLYFIIAIPRFSKVEKWSHPILWWTLVWVLVFVSAWNNQDSEAWQNNLFLKSPFLFMPFALYALPRFSVSYIYSLHVWLLVVILITAAPILTNFFINYNSIMDGMSRGQPIPTPIHHVLYCMISAYAIISNIYILMTERARYPSFRKWIRLAIFVLVIIQHILAVRTGIVILYLSLPFLAWLTFRKNKAILMSLGAIIVAVIISISTIPSLKQKVSYMKYDLEQYQSGGGGAYADSERLHSLKSGLEVWKSSPILGVGYGDLFSEMKMAGIGKYPHSQFIYTLAASGLIGLVLLCFGLLLPYFYYSGPLKGLLTLLYLNLFICLTIDFVLEHAVIVAFLNLFGLVMLRSEE